MLMAGAGLLYFVWPASDTVNTTQEPLSKQEAGPPLPLPSSNKDQLRNKTSDTTKVTEKESSIQNNQPSISNYTATSPSKNSMTAKQPTAVADNPNRSSSNLFTRNQTINKERINETLQTSQEKVSYTTKTEETDKKSEAPKAVQPIYTIRPTTDSGNTNIPNSILTKEDSTIHTELVLTDTLKTTTTIPVPKKTPDSKFSIAFVAGMDASTVKYKYSDKAGINIGILAGYHFTENWSVHTGAIYTRKNYTVAGEDFHAPKNSWVANYKITMVDGFCNMWEVPLLLRYQFSADSKRSFFLSSGISSYIMTRENYNYSYYFNAQPITRNNNYPNGNTHLLSILRVSAGWKKTIGEGSSLLVEPYAALPLAGVGFGSIRLSSFGLNFSLQLRQPSKKK